MLSVQGSQRRRQDHILLSDPIAARANVERLNRDVAC